MLNAYCAWGVYGEEAMREGVRLDSTKVHVMLCLMQEVLTVSHNELKELHSGNLPSIDSLRVQSTQAVCTLHNP